MERRELLQWLVASGGLAALHGLSARDLGALGDEAHRLLSGGPVAVGALSPREQRVVTAAAECIIPRTDTPGATDADVTAFVDVMLAEWYPTDAVERFREGVAALDALSTARHGVAFTDGTVAQQVAMVEALDAEVQALRRTDAAAADRHWFGMLKFLTVWGFCTSEPAMREVFHALPRPLRYDGAAPVRS